MDQIHGASLALISDASKKNGKIPWPEASSMKQSFSIPDSIIYYITKNPSTPEVCSKLIQTCKYFFEKNPILVISYNDENAIFSKYQYDQYFKRPVVLDIDKITSKIWITDEFNLTKNFIPNFNIISKLYRCENARLCLMGLNMVLKDFKALALVFQKFSLCAIQITDNDGNAVMLDSILEAIPNVKEFFYSFDTTTAATTTTIKNIAKLENINNLCEFKLFEIPEVFVVEDLKDFIKKYKDTNIYLHFNEMISEEYKAQLDQLIDMIIALQLSNWRIFHRGRIWRKNMYFEKSLLYVNEEKSNFFDISFFCTLFLLILLLLLLFLL